MNKERFQELITRPDTIEDADLLQLQQVVRDHPSFHNAHLLLLYGLNKQKSGKFDEQLGHSSLYLSNRSFFVNAIYYGWGGSDVAESAVKPLLNIEQTAPIENLPLPDLDTQSKEEAIVANVVEFEIEPAPEIEPDAERMAESPISNHADDSFTFSLEDSQPIESLEKKEIETSEKPGLVSDLLELDMGQAKVEDEQTEDLIDYFLKVNPRIVPKLDLEDSRGDISQPGLEENDELVTETLANIYEQQGHFLKSKEAFQKLILKFPEKSTYFASRIQELEKRIK